MSKELEAKTRLSPRQASPPAPSARGGAPRHPDEEQAKREIWRASARLQLWKDGIIFGIINLFILGTAAACAYIILSRGYSPEVTDQAWKLITLLVSAVLGLLAGKPYWTSEHRRGR